MHSDGFKPEVALEKLGIAIKNKKEIMTEGNIRNFMEIVVTLENEKNI